ncbi:MAG: nodulation protein NfeD [Gammaproteobacteria bacterium]|nr:nodulation protein NfeD [Gammaproteobacteria bacterium]
MRFIAILTVLLLALAAVSARAEGNVVVLEIKGGIGVATADYVTSGIEYAAETGARLVIIEMDTPGGLMAPMDDIVKAVLNSRVPIATYVTPAGARAASAGTYILMASHIAAMAPTTRLGAATPVSLTGNDPTREKPDDTREKPDENDEGEEEAEPDAPSGSDVERKVLNDALAEIRSLAERHGRNADWAEEAVRNAATLTAREALEQNVIEFVAASRAELLTQIDGHEVQINSDTVTLATSNVVVEEFEPNWRIKILSAIANPEIVLLLGLIGLYGLMYEGWNPGAIVPGVVGIICLLLAAYALQVLPVNYAGLALIIVGLALMVAEAFAPSFGALGLGGIAAFIFGAIMMFDTGIPGFGISLTFVIGLAIIAALFIVWLVTFILKLRRRGAVSGADSIIGGIGTAMSDFSGEGKVWLEGEAWAARSKVALEKNQDVIVRGMDGLVLEVEPAPEPDAGDAQLQT